MSDRILHVATAVAWQQAQSRGVYETPDLVETGFIHFCRPDQLAHVLHRYFAGKADLVVVSVDPSLLRARLVYEFSQPGMDSFPHLYGPLNLDAVIDVQSPA